MAQGPGRSARCIYCCTRQVFFVPRPLSLVDVSAWEAGQAAQSIDFINPLIAAGCGPSPPPANQRRRADESFAQPPSTLVLVLQSLAPVASIASKARMWGRAPSASPSGPFPFATPDEHAAENGNPSIHLLSACGWLTVGRAVICSPGELSTESYVRRAAQVKACCVRLGGTNLGLKRASSIFRSFASLRNDPNEP
ncbi:hypothetical protein BGZ61DRAFT_471965 [Ilyonectria robusta]|uniref:uncharacterized protein n=1 Tax=Ilyonectria robusta TaxID=1079257 RepID=UPI001E8E107F|nr:uncharacterized protein BGZ61DRAFT_471965 [Ilyonectria robusta]KAH8735545.1 hypothetical protein BGZ61DRAFT_471965 [Ilyonectria robusta]